MARKVYLIINPASGSARRADIAKLERIAAEHGAELVTLYTQRAGHATELARQASQDGATLVIACGGDGTVNEVINGLVGSTTSLGIIPIGTANVLARETGLPLRAEEALRSALECEEPRPIALGLIESAGQSRYFALVASAGMDATVVHTVSTGLKRYIGKAAYVIRAFGALVRWQSRMLTVTVDGQQHEAQFVAACNGSKYAGEFIMAPTADITQARLEVVMLKQAGRWAMLRFALAFAMGRHLKMRGVEVVSGERVDIEGEAHLQIDGDAFGTVPASVSVIADAIRLAY